MMIGTTVYELTTFEILVGGMVMFVIGFIVAIIAMVAFFCWVSNAACSKPKTDAKIPEQEVTQVKRRRRRAYN